MKTFANGPYLLIHPSGEIERISLNCTYPSRLHQMHELIGCSCIEQVRTLLPGIVIIVDESGKIKTPQQPMNEVASSLYAGYVYGGDYIAGPAIVAALAPTGPHRELDLCSLSNVDLAFLSIYLGMELPDEEDEP